MRFFLFTIVIFFSFLNFSFAQEAIEIHDALNRKMINVTAKGNGGYTQKCLKVIVKNISKIKLKLKINAGTKFTCTAIEEQNLIVTEFLAFDMFPAQTKEMDVFAMCIESHDGSPAYNVPFTLGENATGELLKLTNLIAEKGYQNSTAQSAVWAITNGGSIKDIYGTDEAMAKTLASFVSESTGQAMPVHIPVKPHAIIAIKKTFTYQVTAPIVVSYGVYDTLGNPLIIIKKDISLPSALHTFKVVLNQVADSNAKFLIRLVEKNGKVLKEIPVSIHDKPEDQSPTQKISVSLNYTLLKQTKANLSVYDEEGNMMQEIYKDKLFFEGNHNIKFDFFHTKPAGTKFLVRMNSLDKVIVEKEIK